MTLLTQSATAAGADAAAGINVADETLLTFAELARRMPRRRGGRPVHPGTIHRWRARGVRGVRLEAVRVGGSWLTSWEAFQRFCAALTSGSPPAGPVISPTRSTGGADHSSAEIDRRLSEHGL